MEKIYTDKAPEPVGPYSQAIRAGHFLFISGQIGVNPETGKMVEGGIETETRQVIENLKAILKSTELGLKNVIKTSIYLADMSDFDKVNQIYSEYFAEFKPARVTIEVSAMPKDALIEIEAIAIKYKTQN
jgi:2-iminobutanoate/2-iminopropanoate deaminase